MVLSFVRSLFFAAIFVLAPLAAHAQCVVAGAAIDARDVQVRAGARTFRVHIYRTAVRATPARSTSAPTPIEVRGFLRFSGRVRSSELHYAIATPVVLGHGVLRVSSRIPLGLRDVRASADAIVATLDDGNIRIRDMEIPCDAVVLADRWQDTAFADGFASGSLRTYVSSDCDAPPIALLVLVRLAAEGNALRQRLGRLQPIEYSADDRVAGRRMLRGASAFVRASPDQREGIRISVRDRRDVPFDVMAERDGWTHVRLSWRDGSVLDGWIATRELRAWTRRTDVGLGNLGTIGHGGGGGTGGLLGPARIRVGAAVYASAGGAQWATVEGRGSVTVNVEQPGSWIAIHEIPRLRSDRSPIAWVRRDDVTFGVSDYRGLVLREATPGVTFPILVENVAASSEAYAAGLRSGDRIVRMDGLPEGQWIDLDSMRRHWGREGARLSVQRGRRTIRIAIAIREGCERHGLHGSVPYHCICPF